MKSENWLVTTGTKKGPFIIIYLKKKGTETKSKVSDSVRTGDDRVSSLSL